MNSSILILQNWLSLHCNGIWEHGKGIEISTIDNPGWYVEIDLSGTLLETCVMDSVHMNLADDDWISCSVKDKKYVGSGDPQKLSEILRIFGGFWETNRIDSGL